MPLEMEARDGVGSGDGGALEDGGCDHGEGVEDSEGNEDVDGAAVGTEGAGGTRGGEERLVVEGEDRELDEGEGDDVEGPVEEPCHSRAEEGGLHLREVGILEEVSVGKGDVIN